MPRPTSSAISRNVQSNLGVNASLTGPTFIITPTIGISAARLDTLGINIKSFKEPLTKAIKAILIPSIRENFDSEGRPDRWTPLAEYTLTKRLAQGTGTSILNATGALKKVATQQNIWTVDTQTASIRDLPDKVWYGKVHQAGYGSQGAVKVAVTGTKTKNAKGYFGSTVKATKKGKAASIPARPFLMIQDEDQDDIMQLFIDWFEERAEKAWPSGGIL